MNRAAMNEMQTVLREIREELTFVSWRRDSLTEEAGHISATIQSILRRSRRHQHEAVHEGTPRQLTFEEVAPLHWGGETHFDQGTQVISQ